MLDLGQVLQSMRTYWDIRGYPKDILDLGQVHVATQCNIQCNIQCMRT